MGFYTTTSVTEKPHPETPSCGQKTASGKFFTYPIKTQHKNRHNSLITNQEKPLSTHETASGVFYYKYRHYSAELGRWPSRDPIEEDGGVNLYAFVGNEPVAKWDELGYRYKFHGVERVKSIQAGRTLGFFDGTCAVITACRKCGVTRRWHTQLVTFWVHTKIYVRTHMAGRKSNRSIVHIKRPEKAILATIAHEKIHEKAAKEWHDKSELNIKVDFSYVNSFETREECQAYRKIKMKHWKDSWQAYNKEQGQHPNKYFENDPSIGSGLESSDYPADVIRSANNPNANIEHLWNFTFKGYGGFK